ncbi:unnamed protein product, partial [marine sediment metagenome]
MICKIIFSIWGFAELCLPYAAVIDIDKEKLPRPENVNKWSSSKFAGTLRHNLSC